MSSIDPGGGSESPPDLSNLQANFGQQQAKISALKELVRQSEVAQGQKTANAQEKVKNIAQRLSHLKSKAFRSKKGGADKSIREEADEPHPTDDSDVVAEQPSTTKARSETPGSEKIQLLRKQMEENRQKIAEREHNKRDIEELVTQLKAKFDHNQMAMDKSSQLGRSVGDLSVMAPVTITKDKFQSASDLTGFSSHLDKERIKYLEKRLREMEIDIKNKENEFLHKDPEAEHLKVIKHLEGKILDFEENIKEKECVIEARTQAVSLLSENMSMKGKNTIDLLEDTKQEMISMQQTFVEAEENYKADIEELRAELDEKTAKISELNDVNDILESTRFDLTCSTSSLKSKISELEAECVKLTALNVSQQQQIDEFKSGQHTTTTETADQNLQPTDEDDLRDQIHLLEKTLDDHRKECAEHAAHIDKLENDLMEKTVEYDVLDANFLVLQEKVKSMAPKPLFSNETTTTDAEIARLQSELDAALTNGAKSQMKIHQLEREIDDLAKKPAAPPLPQRKQSPASTDDVARVTSDLQTIEMEEKIESHMKTIEELRCQIMRLNAEKVDLNRRLNNYIAENIELLDKVEKLSKGSSAESIEIVENLTTQEKLEMAQFQFADAQTFEKPIVDDDTIDTEAMSQDLSESLVKLREDSSILMHKIEMFTNERREVLDKMEDLSAENAAYTQQIQELTVAKVTLTKEFALLKKEQTRLQKKLKVTEQEKHDLAQNVKELAINRHALQEEINAMTKEKMVADESNRESYVKGLSMLDGELENYRKTKDKNAKITVSKKLAKEAKNVHTLMTQLLADFDMNLEQTTAAECELRTLRLVQEEAVHRLTASPQPDDFVLPDDDELDECREELERLVVTELNAVQESEGSSINTDEPIATAEEIPPIKSIPEELHQQELQKLRIDFENRLDACYKEIDILKSLAAEQKQQLITTFMEHETEIEDKLNTCSALEQQLQNLTRELEVTKNQMSTSHDTYVAELQNKIEALKGIFDENNDLLEHQATELRNKQDTIESLNGQIMNLYGTMEENANKVLTMEDEISQLNELIDTNQTEIFKLERANSEHSQIIVKLNDTINLMTLKISDLNDKRRSDNDRLEETIRNLRETIDRKTKEIAEQKNRTSSSDNNGAELKEKIHELEETVTGLETKNKEQLDKLKKFAANLKKKNALCLELEEKLSGLQNVAQSPVDSNEIVELNKLLEQRSQELSNAQHLHIEAQVELNRLQHELIVNETMQKQSVATDEIGHLSDENCALKNRIEKLLGQNRQYQCELQADRDKANEFATYKEETVSKIDDLTETLAQKEDSVNQLTRKVEQIRLESMQSLNELEQTINKLRTDSKHFEQESGQLQASLDILSSEVAEIKEDLRQKNLKLEKCKAIIKEKNREIKRLQELSSELTAKLSANTDNNAADQTDAASELEKLRAEMIDCVDEHKTRQAATDAKLQENQLYIETIESENAELKAKIAKLEEGIGYIEERRSSLERQTANLDAELQEKSIEFKQNEDELVQRLTALSKHDELIERQFKEVVDEKDELQANLRDMEADKTQMLRKIGTLETQISDIQNNLLAELTGDNASLTEMNTFLRTELKRQTSDFERKLTEKSAEVVDLENDLVAQMQRIENERRLLQESLEKANDENTELRYDVGGLKDSVAALEDANMDLEREMTGLKLEYENLHQNQIEIQEMRMQVVHDQTEIENLKSQNQAIMQSHEMEQSTLRQHIHDLELTVVRNQNEIETLTEQNVATLQNNEFEMSALRQQIDELDSLKTHFGQNQTDDQIFIQNESERLRTLLETKEEEIQNYQRQNLQLQMSVQFAAPAAAIDPFAGLSAANSFDAKSESESLKERIRRLEAELQVACDNAQRIQTANETTQNEAVVSKDMARQMETKLQNLSNDLQVLQMTNNELSNDIAARQTAIINLQEFNENLIEDNKHMKTELVTFQNQCTAKDGELMELRERLAEQIAEPIATAAQHSEQMAAVASMAEHCRDVAGLEQYISDLQIQLRISTNDCEQFTDTIRSLEHEIQTANGTIAELQNELKVTRDNQVISDLEKLIIPDVAVERIPQPSVMPSFNSAMFFADMPIQSSPFDEPLAVVSSDGVDRGEATPVSEEIIAPKHAYLCQVDEQRPTSGFVETTMTDDEWGFGSNDAMLEEQHHQQSSAMVGSMSLVPPHIGLEVKIQEYEDKVQELQLECSRLREEIAAQKVTSSKMLKKLKDYKLRNDDLTRNQRKSGSVESNDLDLAIQDELNSQIKTMETKLKELKIDYEREQAEKQALTKRVDVLTAAGDRLTDMKERQDKEMENCRSTIQDLHYKLKQLEEWGDKSDSVLINEEVQKLQKQLQDERSHTLVLEERIRKLQNSLLARDDADQDLSDAAEQLHNLRQEYDTQLAAKNATIDSLQSDVKHLNAEIEHSISTIDVLSNESKNIKTNLDQLMAEHKLKIDENQSLSEQLSELNKKNQELANEIERMNGSNMFKDYADANPEIVQELEQKIQDLTAAVQYKDAEILHLNKKADDAIREDQTESLVHEILAKNSEITTLKAQAKQLENDKNELENDLSLQLTKEMASATSGVGARELQEKIDRLEATLTELRAEKQQMEHELDVLNEQVLKSLAFEDEMRQTILDMDVKNSEIAELRNSLAQVQRTSDGVAITSIDETVNKLNSEWEQEAEQRCAKVADSWRQHLAERDEEFVAMESHLKREITHLHEQLADNGGTTSEDDAKVDGAPVIGDADTADVELKAIVDKQEKEIVSLKQQLAIRSAEYARIATQIDPFGQMSSSRNVMSINLNKSAATTATAFDASGNKSELDLALYMLYQRDMRCEELTEELVHLLEERDTLQLKLSNSIRMVEEIKRKGGDDSTVDADAGPDSLRSQHSCEQLTEKISQLHAPVENSRTKKLIEERKYNQRQMALLQQDVATLPPEAVAELIGTDYNLARQSQSQSQNPSSLILNWLWGKSTSDN